MVYLFWRVYYYCYFWLLFNIAWLLSDLFRLRKTNDSLSRTVGQERT
jgi:hypothetical protein